MLSQPGNVRLGGAQLLRVRRRRLACLMFGAGGVLRNRGLVLPRDLALRPQPRVAVFGFRHPLDNEMT